MPDIKIKVPDGSFSAYLAVPKSSSAPGILVIQEIFGVNRVMRDLADGFAAKGYLALCPDLFWRQEPGVQITDKTDEEWQRAFKLMQGFNQTKGVEDLIASLDHLRGRGECSGKAGTVGYCLGGKLAYFMATRSTADCNVSYYGVGIETVLDEAGAITKPLMMHIAEKDRFVSPEAQKQILEALGKNPRVEMHVYPGCDHAFARQGGAHWNAEAARLANQRTEGFFKKYLR
ncbi:MAG TPA: dienelactone hydrolase family protein [Steroidobacter sp.]|jgi:carboxymethylenebutenolidase|nr:dienelactone hydrolase family protein [Steroidobacter sp.]